ncbi:hypothetical protein I204_02641 [Kwoniella mangroviensis CBS 8886]|nr:hypothetical protein I204_02641 [Kwoniella mangroviensis CBS 8886]
MPPKRSKPSIQSSSHAPAPTPPLSPHIWSKLPIEIIHNIFSFTTDRGTLAAWTLVSKSFNQKATPLIWNSISGLPPSIRTSRWGPEVLSLVKIYSMTNHDEEWCYHYRKTFSKVKLPNLTTLRFTFDKIKKGKSTRLLYTQSTDGGYTNCRMIDNIKPKAIVYEKRESSSFTIEPKRLPAKVWSMIETLIILINPVGNGEHHVSSTFLSEWSPNLKRVFWIYDPSVIEEINTQKNSGEIKSTEYKIKKTMMDEFILLTHLLVSNPTIRFTTVDCGTTNLRIPLEKHRKSINDAHKEYLKTFNEGYQEDLKAISSTFVYRNTNSEIAANYLIFRTLEEFIQLDEWSQWFDPQEIVRWQGCSKRIDSLVEKSG